jgi:hypothetical protein
VNGDFVIEVMGSRTVQQFIHTYGNNMSFATAGISDVYTTAANLNNGGLEGLYIFKTPAPLAGTNAYGQTYTEEGAPWDWWDNASYEAIAQVYNAALGAPAGYFSADAITGNPDMSAAKGNAYLDTVQGYLNPRMYEVLDLANDIAIINSFDEKINNSTKIYPNPANNFLNIVSLKTGISSVEIYNLNGQLVLNKEVNNNQKTINISSLEGGIYIVDILSENTSVKRKLIVE